MDLTCNVDVDVDLVLVLVMVARVFVDARRVVHEHATDHDHVYDQVYVQVQVQVGSRAERASADNRVEAVGQDRRHLVDLGGSRGERRKEIQRVADRAQQRAPPATSEAPTRIDTAIPIANETHQRARSTVFVRTRG